MHGIFEIPEQVQDTDFSVQKGTELRKYWKDANHCFSTIMMFKWQDGCPTNGSHTPLQDEGEALMVDLVKGSADPIRIQRPEVRDTSTETETDSCQCLS